MNYTNFLQVKFLSHSILSSIFIVHAPLLPLLLMLVAVMLFCWLCSLFLIANACVFHHLVCYCPDSFVRTFLPFFQLGAIHPRPTHLSVCQSDLNFIESFLICYGRQNRFILFALHIYLFLFCFVRKSSNCSSHSVRKFDVQGASLKWANWNDSKHKKHAIKNHRIVWYVNW